jgi:hypothetical protein
LSEDWKKAEDHYKVSVMFIITIFIIIVVLLRTFERKIILNIYGPVMENNICGIRHKEEINTLLKVEDIVPGLEN